MWHPVPWDTVFLFNSEKKEYEPYVNWLNNGVFALIQADIYFPQAQQYTYTGHRVAYDGRIINETTPHVSDNQLSIPLSRSEEPSLKMHQLPDDRLQKQLDQLQK